MTRASWTVRVEREGSYVHLDVVRGAVKVGELTLTAAESVAVLDALSRGLGSTLRVELAQSPTGLTRRAV